MSNKTSAEVVAGMQRRMDRAEMALWHLCHLKSRVEFSVQRRHGENLYAASIRGIHESFDQDESADPLALLEALGNRAFASHIDKCERRDDAQR